MTNLHKLREQIEKDRAAMAVREGRCPKCGSEMQHQAFITEDEAAKGLDRPLSEILSHIYQCLKCGHEEKVKP